MSKCAFCGVEDRDVESHETESLLLVDVLRVTCTVVPRVVVKSIDVKIDLSTASPVSVPERR